MLTSEQLLASSFLGNDVRTWLYALGILLGVFILLKIFQIIILGHLKRLAKKTQTQLDDELIDIVATIRPRVYTLIAVYVALQYVSLSSFLDKAVDIVFLVLIIWEVVQILERLIMFGIRLSLARSEKDEDRNAPVIKNLRFLIRILLWSIGLLMILSNLGVNITSLIAGLGVGGIAIALAAQNILGDLFSSFSIYFDKPFEIDDFIQVGKDSGTVTEIGLKTTRIRTLQGEELVISNKELTSARIQNFGKLTRRRVVVNLGVTYETPTEKVKALPVLLKKLIDSIKDAELDRVHFRDYGDSALKYELVYFVDSSDYYKHMDVLQTVNIAIRELFDKEQIDMAYPTQTLHIQK